MLHVGEYVQGGVATYIKTLLYHPNQPSIEDYLICAYNKSDKYWGIPTSHVFYYHYQRGLQYIPRAMTAIQNCIQEIEPDVIYCHSTWAGVFSRIPLLFKAKTYRVIYNAHGWAFLRDASIAHKRIYALIERLLLRVTDVVINVSKYEFDSAVGYGLKKDKMRVIYSGVSSYKEPVQSPAILPQDKLNLLFVGRLDAQKGLDILLTSIEGLRRSDLHLTIIGDGVLFDNHMIIKKNTPKVTFLGWIPHHELAKYYEACDAVVMPSRWEAFGLVAIEAMKYGKPVIVSNRGALPEIIENNTTGYVLDLDSSSFAQKLEMIDKMELQRLGQNAKREFQQRFTADNMVEKTINFYKN